jgi:twitching motility protein PilT
MDIDLILKTALDLDASDIHIKAGAPPSFRVQGVLMTAPQLPRLSAGDTEALADQIMNDAWRRKLRQDLDIDLSYSLQGYGRFRGSIFYQRGTVAITLRTIPVAVKTIRDLNLPPVLEKISTSERGLVLVTGTTGSGKSTTLASMVDFINTTARRNIITIEDPIEFIHRDKKSTIYQREVGWDVTSFARGLRSALREDPDIIMLGEMRDQETMETALMAAETGHLVLSTLHTVDAVESVNRIIGAFPPHQQRQIRAQLSSIIRAIISMRLVPRADAKGRVPAVEVMIATPYVQECIRDRDKTVLVHDAIASGVSEYGMQTFDQSVYYLYKSGLITMEQAVRHSSSPDNFRLRVQGVQSTSDVALEEMEKSIDRPGPAATPGGPKTR